MKNKDALFNILRVIFVVLLGLNLVTVLVSTDLDTAEVGYDGDQSPEIATELNEDVGGMSQVTGILTILITIGMTATAFALFGNKSWAIGTAMILTGSDAIVKSVNVIAQVVAGETILDLWFGVLMIVVASGLAYGFYKLRLMIVPQIESEKRRTGQVPRVVS